MVTNGTLFWWLNFTKCQGWYLNMFSRPKFPVSLNLKKLASFLWLLKTIWSLQQLKMPLKDFLNLVLVCKEISPRYGGRIKVFFSTAVTLGHFMTKLLITILKHLSTINDKGYPFFKNTCVKKLRSSWNFVQSEQILKHRQARVYQLCIPLAKNDQNGYTRH